MITLFAPDGIGEVHPGDDLAGLIASAVAACPAGTLADGDIVVVTSKIVSKAEGRTVRSADREEMITAETAHTVARRGGTRIVRTHHGLTLAAAGVDASNVEAGSVLLLPADPDASAARLRGALTACTGRRLGVLVSDTAGRAWRIGQTDQAIGSSGIRVLTSYAGRTDPYGNELQVTSMAVADELAAAAELAKGKLDRRPVAVIRGLGALVTQDPAESAAALIRPADLDLFGFGTREAVLVALCRAAGCPEAYEELVGLAGEELVGAVVDRTGLTGSAADLARRLLAAMAYPEVDPPVR